LRETRIVRNGFFFEPVRWQIVTFFSYCDAEAGALAGETAAPTDPSPATAKAATIPATTPTVVPRLKRSLIVLGTSWSFAACRMLRPGGLQSL
jgi:hypothetical protein